jgi:hypothetical protein
MGEVPVVLPGRHFPDVLDPLACGNAQQFYTIVLRRNARPWRVKGDPSCAKDAHRQNRDE